MKLEVVIVVLLSIEDSSVLLREHNSWRPTKGTVFLFKYIVSLVLLLEKKPL